MVMAMGLGKRPVPPPPICINREGGKVIQMGGRLGAPSPPGVHVPLRTGERLGRRARAACILRGSG